ncbi:hypothetical protein NJ76_16675 [Rhodococcus sp. IITR03]|nr:hypothetical protein NJ76_16675 [Rhodococcus sp. IITR03]
MISTFSVLLLPHLDAGYDALSAQGDGTQLAAAAGFEALRGPRRDVQAEALRAFAVEFEGRIRVRQVDV